MNVFFSFDSFMVIYQIVIIHTDTRYCLLYIWAVVLLLLDSRVIINDLDVIWLHVTNHLYHGFPSKTDNSKNCGVNITYFLD